MIIDTIENKREIPAVSESFKKDGYVLEKGLFSSEELAEVRQVVKIFHDKWLKDNQEFYQERAINSAFLTAPKYLNDQQRMVLFDFIGCQKILNILKKAIPQTPAFMNTQLFFNPYNVQQANYWHRDPQYHMDLLQQQAALQGSEVVHIRIPLTHEPGIELVPGSHTRWDSQEELDVRMEQNQHTSSQALATGLEIPLLAGDALLFSANMIHRGLYGMDRFSLDLLYCESEPEFVKFIQPDCLPNSQQLSQLENPNIFIMDKE